MKIVVDAMGTDAYPSADVEGAVLAAGEWHDSIVLVGDEARIRSELSKYQTAGLDIAVVHASQVIEMADKPAESAKRKADSSVHVGLRLLRDGQADAFVSAGNTGGILATATLHTKRIRGVKRPSLTATFPNQKGLTVAGDIGANADCRPEYLAQFGLMASLYAERALGIANPRVALLSNGEEEEKGNTLVKESKEFMKVQSGINFTGNVEPKEVLRGETDVVITDGFTGNILIKSIEATASMMSALIREEIKANPLTALGGAIARPAFRRVAARIDPFEIGGAILLGLEGVVIVAHGRSNGVAIKNAVRQARNAVRSGVVEAIRSGLGRQAANISDD